MWQSVRHVPTSCRSPTQPGHKTDGEEERWWKFYLRKRDTHFNQLPIIKFPIVKEQRIKILDGCKTI